MIGLSHITEYKPPFSQPELRQMDNLPLEKVHALMAARAVRITRTQWLDESVGSVYFWRDVATHSLAPFVAIFLGCVCIGALERRTFKV